MTAVSNRPVPDGYTDQWDYEIWNLGFVFRWSDVYDDWLDCGRTIAVKPGQSLSDAWDDCTDCPMWDDYKIFFGGDDYDD